MEPKSTTQQILFNFKKLIGGILTSIFQNIFVFYIEVVFNST